MKIAIFGKKYSPKDREYLNLLIVKLKDINAQICIYKPFYDLLPTDLNFPNNIIFFTNHKDLSMKLSEKSVDWQLGYILGESLIPSQLPTLSTDAIKSNCIVEVPKDLQDLYQRSRGEGFGDEVKRRILIGAYALSAGYYDAYYLKAQQCRRLVSDDFKQAFNDVDVIMGPTAPTTAFNLGDKTDDPVAMYLADIYTISTNLAGLPAISIPAGFVNGLPVGLQIIGNYFDEARLLNVSHRYQQNTDWHSQIPAAFK
jgi:Asp-tRNA(Asn)/Glu-tRNA(Gln) amidotransferase A subunit family amidase